MAHSATQSDQILLSFFKDKDFNFEDQVGYTRSHEVLVMDDGSMNLKIVFGNQDYCAELVVPLDAILQTVAGCQKHYDLNGGRDKCLEQWGVKNPVSDPLAVFEKEAAAPELLAACETALQEQRSEFFQRGAEFCMTLDAIQARWDKVLADPATPAGKLNAAIRKATGR